MGVISSLIPKRKKGIEYAEGNLGEKLDNDAAVGASVGVALDPTEKNNVTVGKGLLDDALDIKLPTYGGFKYTPFSRSEDTDKAYNQMLGAQTAVSQFPSFSYARDDDLADIMDRILNREDFSYDLNGDALYRQYKDSYTRQGKLAMRDAMGQAAAMTGGYGNSYAQTVGNQAYLGYLSELNNVIPELYSLALDKYNAEGNELLSRYGVLSDDRATEYGKWQDEYSRLLADRDYYSSAYDSAYNKDYASWADEQQNAHDSYLASLKAAEPLKEETKDQEDAEEETGDDEDYKPSREEMNVFEDLGATIPGKYSQVEETLSKLFKEEDIDDFLTVAINVGAITKDEAYEYKEKYNVPLTKRSWLVTDYGGWNLLGGINSTAKVEDHNGTEYSLGTLRKLLMEHEDMERKDATDWIVNNIMNKQGVK